MSIFTHTSPETEFNPENFPQSNGLRDPETTHERPLFVEPPQPYAVTPEMIRQEKEAIKEGGPGYWKTPERRQERKRLKLINKAILSDSSVEGGEPVDSSVYWENIENTKNALTAAETSGEGHRLIDVDPDKDGTQNLRTMTRALDLFGRRAAEEFDIDPAKLPVARGQVEALIRKKAYAVQPLLDLSKEDAVRLEHASEPERKDTPYIPADALEDTADLIDETMGVSSSPGMSLTRKWMDLQDSKESQFASEIVDSSAYILTALSLRKMEETADDQMERKAAQIALEAMQRVSQDASVEVIAHPEASRLVRIAGLLGPWASEMATTAVIKNRLSHTL